MASTSSRGSAAGALRPPAGLVLGSGLVLLALIFVLPQLEGYRDGWAVLAGLTLVCWLLLAAGQSGTGQLVASAGSQELSAVARMRAEMVEQVHGLPEGHPLKRDFPDVLERLDTEILPRLAQLVTKHAELEQRLGGWSAANATVKPDAATLGRLQGLRDRQARVISDLVQQVANMDASLLGLIQEGDEQHMVGQVRQWAEEMEFRWQGMAEVLGEEPMPSPPKPRTP
jgi:hypothetical protein